MRLELLSKKHDKKLLKFELENKDWFESMIPPRDPDFYSLLGITEHIQLFLLEYKARTLIPMLIIDDKENLVGRINVSNIDSNKHQAHIGYRVGQAFTNRGIAKYAVTNMVRIVEKFGIKELLAYASTENIASQKVLKTNGFKAVGLVPNYAELHGVSIDCIEFKLCLS
ncbi:GNAT family N-acetyltransferase [Vibrio tetraodonis]|uniref:GNAT family N-acetyltransferase n=1 Tax=Vibrio tetraodonis TaxID=2231647 RepID=UPI000E0C91F0|nr:GNAT family N-acetyltransferase [Vibrio tetraodonis]